MSAVSSGISTSSNCRPRCFSSIHGAQRPGGVVLVADDESKRRHADGNLAGCSATCAPSPSISIIPSGMWSRCWRGRKCSWARGCASIVRASPPACRPRTCDARASSSRSASRTTPTTSPTCVSRRSARTRARTATTRSVAQQAFAVFLAARNQVEPYADVLPGLTRLARRLPAGLAQQRQRGSRPHRARPPVRGVAERPADRRGQAAPALLRAAGRGAGARARGDPVCGRRRAARRAGGAQRRLCQRVDEPRRAAVAGGARARRSRSSPTCTSSPRRSAPELSARRAAPGRASRPPATA